MIKLHTLSSVFTKSTPPTWYLCHQKRGLYHNGEFIQLDDKQYQMLVLFNDNLGEIISKDTILSTIWHGKVVTEDAVYVLINSLRKVFNDKPKSPKYILTVSGKGYRWINETLEYQAKTNYIIGNALLVAVCVFLVLLSAWFFVANTQVELTNIQKEQFSKARYILNRQDSDHEQAISLLNNLIREAPEYVPAHEALVDVLFTRAINQNFKDQMAVMVLKTALDEAFNVTNSSKVLHYFKARTAFLIDWDFDTADKHFKKALPNAQAHNHYGQFLLAKRDFDGALHHTKQYQYKDTNGYSTESVAWVYMMSENREQAITELEKLRPFAESSFYYHVCLQALYEQIDDQEKAFNELLWLMRNVGYQESEISAIEKTFNANGLAGAYRWLLFEDDKHLNIGQYETPMSLARYAVSAGEYTLALTYLEKAKNDKQVATLWIAADPKFKPLYQDNRFNLFLGSINLSI